jgi:hypothetical protein
VFDGVRERVVIGQERDGRWSMGYFRAGQDLDIESAQACIREPDIRTREGILRETKRFMIGHGQCLMSNLIQSAEQRCQ